MTVRHIGRLGVDLREIGKGPVGLGAGTKCGHSLHIISYGRAAVSDVRTNSLVEISRVPVDEEARWASGSPAVFMTSKFLLIPEGCCGGIGGTRIGMALVIDRLRESFMSIPKVDGTRRLGPVFGLIIEIL